MIGLLLATIQCIGQTFQTQAKFCAYVEHIAKFEGRYYTDALLCQGEHHPTKHRDLNLLMGRVYELELANARLQVQVKAKKK